MMLSRRTLVGIAIVATVSGAWTPALALSERDARAHVEKTIGDLRLLLRQAGTPDSRAPKLRSIMEARANMKLLAKFSAGRAWREMSEAQRSRFTEAYSKFVSVTYARRFDEYSGDPQISIGRALDAGRKGILVETPVAQGNGQPISVEWLVSDRGGRVEIVDLVIEGVSMAATQRDEISKMLQVRGGDIDRLIADLGA